MLRQFLMYYQVVPLYIYTCILFHILFHYGSFGFPGGSDGKESACNAGDLGLIPGLERSPGEGKDYSPQCSGMENSMDCIVCGVAKSQTRLSDFPFSKC